MINRLKYLLLIICVTSFLTCKKSGSNDPPLNPNGCAWFNPPASLCFQIKLDGQILPDMVLRNGVGVSYYYNGEKKYINDLSLATGPYANAGILASRVLALTSAGTDPTNGIKTFYIEYSNYNGFTNDTLFVDYALATPATDCQYLFRQIKFNGQVAFADTSFKYNTVYVLNKR
jgi:hypothetical protein